MSDRPRYITVYESIGGWKAVLVWWNPDMGGFYEPWETGFGYENISSAISEAKAWAKDEGVEYRPPKMKSPSPPAKPVVE